MVAVIQTEFIFKNRYSDETKNDKNTNIAAKLNDFFTEVNVRRNFFRSNCNALENYERTNKTGVKNVQPRLGQPALAQRQMTQR